MQNVNLADEERTRELTERKKKVGKPVYGGFHDDDEDDVPTGVAPCTRCGVDRRARSALVCVSPDHTVVVDARRPHVHVCADMFPAGGTRILAQYDEEKKKTAQAVLTGEEGLPTQRRHYKPPVVCGVNQADAMCVSGSQARACPMTTLLVALPCVRLGPSWCVAGGRC